jgi:hypothetical protein
MLVALRLPAPPGGSGRIGSLIRHGVDPEAETCSPRAGGGAACQRGEPESEVSVAVFQVLKMCLLRVVALRYYLQKFSRSLRLRHLRGEVQLRRQPVSEDSGSR